MASFRERVSVDGAAMGVYVSVPDGAGPFPAVVVIQHRDGLDAFTEEMTDRVASAGCVGVAPDLYHRDGPDCRDDGPTRRERLRDVTVIKDVNATVDFLKRHPAVDGHRLGIVGFCMPSSPISTSSSSPQIVADRRGRHFMRQCSGRIASTSVIPHRAAIHRSA